MQHTPCGTEKARSRAARSSTGYSMLAGMVEQLRKFCVAFSILGCGGCGASPAADIPRRQPRLGKLETQKNRTGRHISERPAIVMSWDAISSAQTGHRRTMSFLALRLWPVSARPCRALDVQSPPVADAALRGLASLVLL